MYCFIYGNDQRDVPNFIWAFLALNFDMSIPTIDMHDILKLFINHDNIVYINSSYVIYSCQPELTSHFLVCLATLSTCFLLIRGDMI
jgi:hypothetical protein